MARPIEYDPQEVLTKLMYLFWEKGYESTSIKDIVAVTNLKPGSLYALYGNKEGIFNAVLKTYSDMTLEVVKSVLQADSDPVQNIKNFLDTLVVSTICDEKVNGCLLVKTLLVVPHKDKKIQDYITSIFNQIEHILEKTIQKAVDNGQTSVDAKYFSKLIITTIYGAHVYLKTNNDTSILKQHVEFLLNTLKNNK